MRCCRVANLVDTLHDGIQGCVVADSRIRAIEVIVDCSGQADDRNIKFISKNTCTCQRAVAADNNQCINAGCSHILVGLFATFFRAELGATCRLEYCASHLNNIRHVLCLKLYDFISQQSSVTTINTFHAYPAKNSRACHGANRRIHSGSITSRR